jgi:hypothetical protein
MSFRIKKSHKFTDQFPNGQDSSKNSSFSDLLSSEDYLFLNLGDKPSSSGRGAAMRAPVKAKKGGNSIHPINSAQADYY